MRWKMIGNVIGALLVCIGLCMSLALVCSLYYRDAGFNPLLESLGIILGFGLLLYLACRTGETRKAINHREGMAITTLCWVAATVFGGLPFYLSGVLPQPVDSIFETMSGFTTTGASVIRDVEILPHSLLFWRSLTHWLGGLGIVLLGLAILPFLGVGGMQLYKAEVPGPVMDKLKPRVKDTALILWKVYLAFTLLEIVLLALGGMPLFDSMCHTFGTIATGGFSTKNASIAHYKNLYFDLVITLFMLIGGLNFSLHFQLFRGKPLALWRDPEARFYLGFFALVTTAVALSVYGKVYPDLGRAFQYAAFQVASIMTTTGYASADFELWPAFPQSLLLLCMLVGGSVGSTGGGVKCMRILVLLKQGYNELLRLIHPRAVRSIKIGREAIPHEVLSSITGFFCPLSDPVPAFRFYRGGNGRRRGYRLYVSVGLHRECGPRPRGRRTHGQLRRSAGPGQVDPDPGHAPGAAGNLYRPGFAGPPFL